MSGGEISALERDRHPWDWYVEEQWVTDRLIDHVALDRDVTYLDPCAGACHIPAALTARGLTAFGTDIVRRTLSPLLIGEHDWLGDQQHLLEFWPRLSIIFNPPYSRQNGKLVRGLAERCIRRAIDVATHQVAALLPIKWLASKGRFALFARDHRPTGIWILCERPSMPPGHLIEEMGERAFDGGKVDYMWVVWDKRADALPFTPTYWISPRD